MKSTLKEIVCEIRSLEPFPRIATRVLEIGAQPHVVPGELISVIQMDPGLTAKVLRLCNSAYYGFQRQIASLDEAAERTGGEMEKLAIRRFVSYVFFRTLGVIVMQAFDAPAFGWIKQLAKDPGLRWMDLAVLVIPLGLLVRDLRSFRSIAKGQLVYLVSFGTIYSLILLGLHARDGGVTGLEPVILALFFGTAVFHSTEYLAIVSWTATRTKNPRGVIRHLAPRWMAFLICFMLVLGLTSLLLIKSEWAQPYKLFQIWIVLNLCVSMLHYAYDGIIWRAPRKQRA